MMQLFQEEKSRVVKKSESGSNIKVSSANSGQSGKAPAPKREIRRRRLIGRHGVPDEEYLEGVRRLAEALGGRRPRGIDFDSKLAVEVGAPSHAGLVRRFGSVERALDLAGVAHLPPKLRPNVEAKQKKLEKALLELAGRPYVFRDELWRYGTLAESLREELRRRGVAVLWRVKAPRLEEALEMYYGGAASRERMREGMGSRAYEMFSRYAEGRSFQDIAKEFGCTREWIRFSVAAGLARLFGLNDPRSDLAGRNHARFVAKLGADAVPVITAQRRKLKISQEKLADLAGIGSSTLWRLEKCWPVTEKVARKTADALEGSIEEFFYRIPPETPGRLEAGGAGESGRDLAVGSLKGDWTDCGPQRLEGCAGAVVDEWKDYPVKGHIWAVGRTDSGEWYFYCGPCCSPDRMIPAGVPWGGELSVHATEGEARAARSEALKSLKTVGNRRLVPDVDRPAIAYSILRGVGRLSLCLAVPRAGILELALLNTGPELRDGHLDHTYLQGLAQRLGLGAGDVYSDLAAALAEAVEESGFPLPGALEWEIEGDGVRWLGSFTGYLGPGGASLGFGGPAAGVLTLEEAARLWRVPGRRIARLLGSGEFPEGTYRRSAGTWLIEWGGLCEVLGLPRRKKRPKEAAYLRLRWDGGELAYRGSEDVIKEFAGRVVRTLLASSGALGQGTGGGGTEVQSQAGGCEKENGRNEIFAKLKKAVRHSREFRRGKSVLLVLHLLGRGAPCREIGDHLKILGVPLRARTCSNFLQNLKSDGLVRRNASGEWELTDEGRRAAATLFERAVGLADGLEEKGT